ncbi:Protein SUPPRESSOR OF npr1-1, CONSTITUTIVE 1 [Morella rubra]|uniref:Protein SUPPRESSOR OF npr1-1, CONSTITUTIVE 1 n=1 Tax=Morella rubra TaxID=262757 RepID=A0A6A1VI25_9ROSI|nr:Protein SUPPRESSOR OF npr1-1, CONSTITUTIVE 1 [Morella rubra]
MEEEDFVMRAMPFEKELCKDKLCKAMQRDSFSVGSAILWDTNGTFLGAAAVKMERLKPVQAETEAAKFGVLELGTNAVEGIVLNLPLLKEERLSVEGFSRMTKLRILKIGNISVVRNFSEVYDMLKTMEWLRDPLKSLSTNELRIMELSGYPLGNLPTNLQLDNLIKLSMQYSNIRKLWEGTKSLSNLKGIDLRWSEHLIEIPDLSGAPNLERLNLEGCKNLTKVHPDIGIHKRLKELILADCKSLESLPEEINLESVKGKNRGHERILGSVVAHGMPDCSIVEVKECGARLLYEGDALEFSNAVAQGWHRAYYHFLSGHDFEKAGDGGGDGDGVLSRPF